MEKIVALDFGSQYAHLIAKRLRMLGFYSEIAQPSCDTSLVADAKGIILSGGPASVYASDAPAFNEKIFSLDIPILGLCYGHQLMAKFYGGKVGATGSGEFGLALMELNEKGKSSPLFEGLETESQVWMSHNDSVLAPGEGFETIASTKNCAAAALQNLRAKRFSLQFHCEVKDTSRGNKILENFARNICGMETNWDADAALSRITDDIKKSAGGKNVLLFLSGGVDSTVSFALLNKALGQERVLGLHIDNGFMRKDESAKVAKAYREHGFSNFMSVDASENFLEAVKGLVDPQEKRKAVGERFVAEREKIMAAQNLDEDKWMLAQGTLYPDIIESGGTKNSRVIKTHHNRVDGIQRLIQKGMVIEPLKDLYKDEVRRIGKKLGLADSLVNRHPFPGPGLSINVLCSNGTLSESDRIDIESAREELSKVKIDMFCEKCSAQLRRFVLPVRSVGVQGDFRTYRFPAAVEFARDENGFFHLPKKWEKLEAMSVAITNSSPHINRAVIKLFQNPGARDEDFKTRKCFCDKESLDCLREVDAIMLRVLREIGWYEKIFQHLSISLPFAATERGRSFVLRPLCSEDVMTARFARLPQDSLMAAVREIARLPFADAVFFDLTNKPPATFGWE